MDQNDFDTTLNHFQTAFNCLRAANSLPMYEATISPTSTATIRRKSKSSLRTSKVLDGVTRVKKMSTKKVSTFVQSQPKNLPKPYVKTNEVDSREVGAV